MLYWSAMEHCINAITVPSKPYLVRRYVSLFSSVGNANKYSLSTGYTIIFSIFLMSPWLSMSRTGSMKRPIPGAFCISSVYSGPLISFQLAQRPWRRFCLPAHMITRRRVHSKDIRPASGAMGSYHKSRRSTRGTERIIFRFSIKRILASSNLSCSPNPCNSSTTFPNFAPPMMPNIPPTPILRLFPLPR